MKKRIALSIVAALTGGLLAAAPASAYSPATATLNAPFAETVAAGIVTSATAHTPPVATFPSTTGADSVTIWQLAGAGNTVTIPAVANPVTPATDFVSVTGATLTPASYTFTNATAGGATLTVTSTSYLRGTLADATSVYNSLSAVTQALYNAPDASPNYTAKAAKIVVPVSTAGSTTVTVSTTIAAADGTTSTSVVQTYTVIGVGGTAWASSTETLNAGAAGFYGGDFAVYGSKYVSGNEVAVVTVDQFDNTGVGADASLTKAVSATITGVGSFVANNSAQSTQYVTFAAGGTNSRDINIYSDGRAGKGVVTLFVDGKEIGSETVMFYGEPATVTAVGVRTIGHAGGYQTGNSGVVGTTAASILGGTVPTVLNEPAIAVVVKDSNGTAIPNAVVSAASSNGLVLASAALGFTEDGSSTKYSAGIWFQHWNYTSADLSASGDSASFTFSTVTSTGTVISSSPVKITMGGSAKTVTLGFDKATYTQGALATLTVTAKDSSGNPVYDGASVLDAAGLISNLNTGNGLAAAKTLGGTVKYALYTPVVVGTWTVSGKDSRGNAISASATISNSDPATAANSAAIATLQTSVAALQTTVASLVASLTAQIKVINSALAKIAKKLKVKI